MEESMDNDHRRFGRIREILLTIIALTFVPLFCDLDKEEREHEDR